MRRVIFVLSAIIFLALTAASGCWAEDQPAAPPAAPPAATPSSPPPAKTPAADNAGQPAPNKSAPGAGNAGPPTENKSAQTAGSSGQSASNKSESSAGNAGQPANKPTPGERCVQHTPEKDQETGKLMTARETAVKEVGDELRSLAHATGGNLESTSYWMPAGAPFKVAINEPYDANRRYFAYVEPTEHAAGNVNMYGFMEGSDVGAVEIPANDPLVKANRVDPGATLLTLQIPDSVGGFWSPVDLYVWSCTGASVKSRSELTINATSWHASLLIAVPAVLLLYVLAALATRATDVRPDVSFFRYFDPVYMTAGSDGKGSLSKLQILFFSLIVFGLLSYILGRTGALSDLSSSILLLLGITGVGSAAAKGADEQKNSLSFDNRAWLITKKWLPDEGWAAVNKASWHDIITNAGGEFDVYRYQSCIFSLTVGGALLVNGVNQLASFTIPETLLGILGLSQVVYVGGKLVSTSSVAELNDAVDKARAAEQTFIKDAATKPDPNPAAGGTPLDVAIRRAGKTGYDDYMDKARYARTLFLSQITGRTVKEEQLAPAVTS
jgi:hypothetical protein